MSVARRLLRGMAVGQQRSTVCSRSLLLGVYDHSRLSLSTNVQLPVGDRHTITKRFTSHVHEIGLAEIHIRSSRVEQRDLNNTTIIYEMHEEVMYVDNVAVLSMLETCRLFYASLQNFTVRLGLITKNVIINNLHRTPPCSVYSGGQIYSLIKSNVYVTTFNGIRLIQMSGTKRKSLLSTSNQR